MCVCTVWPKTWILLQIIANCKVELLFVKKIFPEFFFFYIFNRKWANSTPIMYEISKHIKSFKNQKFNFRIYVSFACFLSKVNTDLTSTELYFHSIYSLRSLIASSRKLCLQILEFISKNQVIVRFSFLLWLAVWNRIVSMSEREEGYVIRKLPTVVLTLILCKSRFCIY